MIELPQEKVGKLVYGWMRQYPLKLQAAADSSYAEWAA